MFIHHYFFPSLTPYVVILVRCLVRGLAVFSLHFQKESGWVLILMIHIQYVTLNFVSLYTHFLNFFFSYLLIFFSSSQDLPALYLQGGAIIPFGPPHQHVGEASLSDDSSLIVALDEHGIAKSNFISRSIKVFCRLKENRCHK